MHSNIKSVLSEDVLRDKIQGIIFGAAIGDGVGLATEFMHKEQAMKLYGNGPVKFGNAKDGHPFWRDSFRSRWFENDFTDDTDQHLLILQCLLADRGTLNPNRFAYRLKEWTFIGFPELDDKAPCGIGLTVGSTCSHPDMEADIWNTKGRNLAANGALMRTAVIGAPYFWDERKVVENSMLAAKVTHADPRSVTSSVILSVIISKLLRSTLETEDGCSDDDKKYFTEMLQLGSTEDKSYLEKFASFPSPSPKPLNNQLKKKVVRQMRRLSAYLTNQPVNPTFDLDFKIPPQHPVDKNRLDKPATIREGVNCMDKFGVDQEMMKICKNIVEKYKFLLDGHPLCPSKDNSDSAVKEETNWSEQLDKPCFA